MATRRLGRGLSALIPDVAEDDVAQKNSLTQIEISRISPNPYQPRIEFDPQALEELKNSIAENGVITPITVRVHENGYQLIAGERRLRAVQELGLPSIPAYILDIQNDRQMLEMSLVENIQRENLNPIEEALGYQRLIEECQLTQEQAAVRVGKERATVTNSLRLLKLPAPIQESLRKKEISAGHARAILSCSDEQAQLLLWKKIVAQGMSVRKAEQQAKKGKERTARPKDKGTKPNPEVLEAEDKLRQVFGTQVHIHMRDKGGAIELEFYSQNDLERLIELMLQLR